MLLLMASEPVPIIRYKGSIEPVSFEDVTTPIFQQFTPEGSEEYATELTAKLKEAKTPVVKQPKKTLNQQQSERSTALLQIMLVASLLGLLMLGAPLVLTWRYPRRVHVITGYSMISAALFILVGGIFVGLYALTRYTSQLVSTAYNPQLSITESLFDFLISRADSLVAIGPTIIEPTITAIKAGPDSPALQVILNNVQGFADTLSGFGAVARLAQVLSNVYSLFPLALLLVVFVLFIRNALPTMQEIMRLPGRAARGEDQAARRTIRFTFQHIRKEAVYALAVIAVLIVLTLIVASVGRGAIEPALEIVLNYILAAMIYAQTEAGAQPGMIVFCTTVALLFLVMVLSVTTVTAVLFLSRTSRVIRTVTRNGAGVRSERRYFLQGLGGTVWAMFIPVIYATAASPAISLFGQKAVDARAWGVLFGLIPLALVGGFVVAFWAGNGFKTLMFVRHYSVGASGKSDQQRDGVEPTATVLIGAASIATETGETGAA